MIKLKQLNVLIIGDPFARSGGGRRCFEVIKRYKEYGASPILVIPPFNNEVFRMASSLPELDKNGVRVVGSELSLRYAQKKKTYERMSLIGYGELSFLASRFSEEICNLLRNTKIDLVVGHHELWDVVQTTHQIAEKLSLKSAIVLQLPPFYQNSHKASELDMLDSLSMSQLSKHHPLFTYYRFISPTFGRKIASILYTTMIDIIGETTRSAYYKLTLLNNLNNIDKILAVSKSIPFEMGESWINKIAVIEPACSIEQDWKHDNEKGKEEYVLYYARLAPTKGVLEVPLIWYEFLKKSQRKMHLYVVGAFEDKHVEDAFYVLVNKLGLANEIKCLAYVERKRLINLVANASAVIYPSHVDSNPLVILECLSLGTPVVAYDIPAIRLNYSNIAGVTIVPEYDIKEMAHRLKQLIQSKNNFEAIQQPTWNQVAEAELRSIQVLATT